MKQPLRRPLLTLISIITVLSLAFSITAPAYAQKENPGKGGENEGQGQGQEKSLLKLFERLLAWEERQTAQLEQAKEIGDLFQEYIDNIDDETIRALMQEELDAYLAEVNEARGFFVLAQTTLATHYGVDGVGSVYSVKSARQMVKVASQSLGKSHRLLVNAVKNLRQAFRETQTQNQNSPAVLVQTSP